MNSSIKVLSFAVFLLLISISESIGQPQFKIKLLLTGASVSDTLWLGMSPYNTRCFDYGAEVPPEWRESIPPPIGPGMKIRTQFLDMPDCPFPFGKWPYDYRQYPCSPHVDTFKIHVEGSDIVNGMTISWTPNPCLYGNRWDLIKSGDLPFDMCSATSFTDPNATHDSELDYLIIRIDDSLPPTFTTSTDSLDFGYVAVGGSVIQVLGVSNIGGSALNIYGATPSSGYSVMPPPPGSYPVYIPEGGSNNFSITFAPITAGTFSGNVVFSHNATGGTTNIVVTGEAYDPAVTTLVSMNSGWNLVSVPRVQPDSSVTYIFPKALGGVAYEYVPGAGYVPATILIPGKGYWVYYSGSESVPISGPAPGPITINAYSGWNLFGSRDTPVDLSSLLLSGGATIYGGVAYAYIPGTGYVPVTVINPAQGVWVYLTADCTITIPGT